MGLEAESMFINTMSLTKLYENEMFDPFDKFPILLGLVKVLVCVFLSTAEALRMRVE